MRQTAHREPGEVRSPGLNSSYGRVASVALKTLAVLTALCVLFFTTGAPAQDAIDDTESEDTSDAEDFGTPDSEDSDTSISGETAEEEQASSEKPALEAAASVGTHSFASAPETLGAGEKNGRAPADADEDAANK